MGAQLTPPRQYLVRHAERLLPTDTDDFEVLQGLAVGGLGAAWGAGAFPFRASELRGLPVGEADLIPHYERLYRRIGVAGHRDDLEQFFGWSDALLPPPDLDRNSAAVLRRYLRSRETLNRRGWFMGRPRLAVCTVSFRGRGPLAYRDMEFWADTDRSVYRPRWTLEDLRARPNFSYEPGWLVSRFVEHPDGWVEVTARQVGAAAIRTLRSRAVILAAGTLESARIALRSLNVFGKPVPLLTNPYTYVPVLNLGMLGREETDRRHSLAQLTGILTPRIPDDDPTQVQYYTYRSLLGFKIAREIPLPLPTALQLVRTLTPLLGIVAINHADRLGPGKRAYLLKGTGPAETGADEVLRIEYQRTSTETRSARAAERRVMRQFLRLGCLPLRVIRLPDGSSIHYAGTIPMGPGPEPITSEADGRLSSTRAVYVADGSIFRHLPAKGLTFTIMAHADRVGTLLSARLRSAVPP